MMLPHSSTDFLSKLIFAMLCSFLVWPLKCCYSVLVLLYVGPLLIDFIDVFVFYRSWAAEAM